MEACVEFVSSCEDGEEIAIDLDSETLPEEAWQRVLSDHSFTVCKKDRYLYAQRRPAPLPPTLNLEVETNLETIQRRGSNLKTIQRRGSVDDDPWVYCQRLTGDAESEITADLGKHSQVVGFGSSNQIVYCAFSLVSSFKEDIGGGFLVRVDVEKLECGVQDSVKEQLVRGYFVDHFTLSIDPCGPACQGIVRFTPEPENSKWQVTTQQGTEIGLSVGAGVPNPTGNISGSVKWTGQRGTTEDYQFWSWRRESCGAGRRTARFTWHLEQWRKPRLEYDAEKPHRCGVPIPELPFDGDSMCLPPRSACVEWHVPAEMVQPQLEISWTLQVRASIKFVEIKKGIAFMRRKARSHELHVFIPILQVLKARLP